MAAAVGIKLTLHGPDDEIKTSRAVSELDSDDDADSADFDLPDCDGVGGGDDDLPPVVPSRSPDTSSPSQNCTSPSSSEHFGAVDGTAQNNISNTTLPSSTMDPVVNAGDEGLLGKRFSGVT